PSDLFAVPILTPGARLPVVGPRSGPFLGAVVLAMPMDTGLAAIVKNATAATRTGETVVFRFDHDPAYLTPLRHSSAGFQSDLRSVEALSRLIGRVGGTEIAFGELADYRGEAVFVSA